MHHVENVLIKAFGQKMFQRRVKSGHRHRLRAVGRHHIDQVLTEAIDQPRLPLGVVVDGLNDFWCEELAGFLLMLVDQFLNFRKGEVGNLQLIHNVKG